MADANYPDDLRYHAAHDWAKLDGDVATFGVTWHAQDALGDIARWLQAKMQVAGVASLFADFRLLPTDPDLAVAARSLRLCLHVVIKEPAALMPQMLETMPAQMEA